MYVKLNSKQISVELLSPLCNFEEDSLQNHTLILISGFWSLFQHGGMASAEDDFENRVTAKNSNTSRSLKLKTE